MLLWWVQWRNQLWPLMKGGVVQGDGDPCGDELRRKVALSVGSGGGRLQLVAGGEGVRVGHGGGPGPAGSGEHCAGSAHLTSAQELILYAVSSDTAVVAVAAAGKVKTTDPAGAKKEDRVQHHLAQQLLVLGGPYLGREIDEHLG